MFGDWGARSGPGVTYRYPRVDQLQIRGLDGEEILIHIQHVVLPRGHRKAVQCPICLRQVLDLRGSAKCSGPSHGGPGRALPPPGPGGGLVEQCQGCGGAPSGSVGLRPHAALQTAGGGGIAVRERQIQLQRSVGNFRSNRGKIGCRNQTPRGLTELPEWLRMVLCLFKRGQQVSQLQEATLNIAMELEHEPMGRWASSCNLCCCLEMGPRCEKKALHSTTERGLCNQSTQGKQAKTTCGKFAGNCGKLREIAGELRKIA